MAIKKNIAFFFLILLFAISLSSCKTQNISTSKVKTKLPEFSWDTMPLYMHLRKSTAFTKEEIRFIAKHPLITFEKSTGNRTYESTEQGVIQAAKSVKKISPDAKILYYKNVVVNWGGYKEDEDFLKKHPEAILVDDNGKNALMPNKKTGFFDLSQKSVRSYWLGHVAKMAKNPAIDGLFMDANIKVLVPNFFKNRVGEAKQKAIELGYLSMMTDLNSQIGKDNLFIANMIRVRPEFEDSGREYLKLFDGSYIEGFENESFGMNYEDYLAKGIEAVQKSAREGKVIAMTLGIGEALNSTHEGIDDIREKLNKNDDFTKRLDYLLAIFLVCAEKYSYVYPHDGYGIEKSAVWLKTFPQYEKPLGKPKGYAKRDGYIYTRSFEHLDVFLDIKNKTATLNFK